MKTLAKALERGVAIDIGYGYRLDGKTSMLSTSRGARRELASLAKRSRENPNWGWLRFAEIGTHEKMLMVDDDYIVCGSFNWLSNASVRNRERSYRIDDVDLARSERERIRNIVEEHLPAGS